MIILIVIIASLVALSNITGRDVMMLFLLTITGIAFVISAPIFVHSSFPKEEVEINSSKIVSLKLENEIYGDFFLGSGVVEGKEYYYTFMAEGGGYKRVKLEASKCIIIEGIEEPTIIEKVTRSKIPAYISLTNINIDKTYYLKVPENTIIKEFVL